MLMNGSSLLDTYSFLQEFLYIPFGAVFIMRLYDLLKNKKSLESNLSFILFSGKIFYRLELLVS